MTESVFQLPRDPETVEWLADLVTGNTGPKYRSADDTVTFMKRARVKVLPKPDKSRKRWAVRALNDCWDEPGALQRIVLCLVDHGEHQSKNDAYTVATLLNERLTTEGYALVAQSWGYELHAIAPAQKWEGPGRMPNFETIIPEKPLRDLAVDRWREAGACTSVEAHLQAIVALAGVLEASLSSYVSAHRDRIPLNRIPKNRNGDRLPLRWWSLSEFINVAHELGAVRRPAKDFTRLLRDYRNLLHPLTQLEEKVSADAQICNIC